MAPTVVIAAVVICRLDSVYRGERRSFHNYVYRHWSMSRSKIGVEEESEASTKGPRQHTGLGLVYRLP